MTCTKCGGRIVNENFRGMKCDKCQACGDIKYRGLERREPRSRTVFYRNYPEPAEEVQN